MRPFALTGKERRRCSPALTCSLRGPDVRSRTSQRLKSQARTLARAGVTTTLATAAARRSTPRAARAPRRHPTRAAGERDGGGDEATATDPTHPYPRRMRPEGRELPPRSHRFSLPNGRPRPSRALRQALHRPRSCEGHPSRRRSSPRHGAPRRRARGPRARRRSGSGHAEAGLVAGVDARAHSRREGGEPIKPTGKVIYVRTPHGMAAEYPAEAILAGFAMSGETEPAQIIAAILGRGCIPVLDVDFDGSYLIRSATRAHFVPFTSKGGVA